jgi:hypothetical protein
MDTWFKWWVTAIYTFVSTAVAAFASDALCPFFSNVIEDHKTQYIPYSKFTCLLMLQCFTIYGVIMSVIGMFVALTQVDFMLIRILADLTISCAIRTSTSSGMTRGNTQIILKANKTVRYRELWSTTLKYFKVTI